MKCPNCGNKDLLVDHSSGIYYCRNCFHAVKSQAVLRRQKVFENAEKRHRRRIIDGK